MNADELTPRDTSYYRTMPKERLLQLWDARLGRLVKLVNLRAPQLLIDLTRQLVNEAKDAYQGRMGIEGN